MRLSYHFGVFAVHYLPTSVPNTRPSVFVFGRSFCFFVFYNFYTSLAKLGQRSSIRLKRCQVLFVIYLPYRDGRTATRCLSPRPRLRALPALPLFRAH